VGAESSSLYRISRAAPPARARERLPFVLPEFSRQAWVGELARSVWEPRIARVMRAWLDIEWLSVAARMRDCGLMWTPLNLLPALIPMWETAGLSAIQLQIADSHFGGNAEAPPASAVGLVCVAVGALEKVAELREAWAAADHDAVGTLLGYPSCCRLFFREVWAGQHCLDTTWAMAEHTSRGARNQTIRIELPEETPPLANILWRWIGVRATPHLPCRFDCGPSIEFARNLLKIGRKVGYGDEIDWTEEILKWPVEWSALHGIAEVKSPLMKLSTRTDATSAKCVVQWTGTSYPAEGAIGLQFPYRLPTKPMLTQSRAYQRGLANSVQNESDQAWRYADNGFATAEAMHELHEPIVRLARSALANERGNVLDLGCGNGTLLAKVCEGRSDLISYGVDNNGNVLEHARQLLPQFAGNFVQGDLFESDLWDDGKRHYSLALLMLGRLFEAPEQTAMRMLHRLRQSCSRVLAYAYPDWRGQPLAAIARSFGLELEESDCATAAYLKGARSQTE
jgi:SAM-dependent methyltransferase